MNLKEYVEENSTECVVCKLFRNRPWLKEEIESALQEDNPPSVAMIRGYLNHLGFAFTRSNVRSHVESRHGLKVRSKEKVDDVFDDTPSVYDLSAMEIK